MKFRCKLSGTVVEFFYDHDIKDMLEHPQYEAVVEEQEVDNKVEAKKASKKVVNTSIGE